MFERKQNLFPESMTLSDIKLKHFKVMLDCHTLSILNYSDKNAPFINAYT